jgi:hypothetical protein
VLRNHFRQTHTIFACESPHVCKAGAFTGRAANIQEKMDSMSIYGETTYLKI